MLFASTLRVAVASPLQDYMLYCMGCHGTNAAGVPGKVPALATTLDLLLRTAAGREYLLRVPGAANSALSDARLAAVLNWLAGSYASAALAAGAAPFSSEEVGHWRRRPLASVWQTRASVLADPASQNRKLAVTP